MLRSMKGWISRLLKMMVSWLDDEPGAEEFYTALFLYSPLPTIICRKNYQVVEVNDALCVTLGYQRWELINKPLDLLIPEESREAHRTVFNAYLADPTRRPMAESRVFNALHKDGHKVPVVIELSPILTQGHTFAAATLRAVEGGRDSNE